MNFEFYEFIKTHYRGLMLAIVILYTFTFIPLALTFTQISSSYWFFYSATSFLALLASYLFFNVIKHAAVEINMRVVIIQFELLALMFALIFIILPLNASDIINAFNENILSTMFMEETSQNMYIGPNRIFASLFYIQFINTYLIISYIRAKIKK